MTTYYGKPLGVSGVPTKRISPARRLRALIPPLTADRARTLADDMEATVVLTLGPETITGHRLGPREGKGRCAVPINVRIREALRIPEGLTGEVTAYRAGYADGFVDSVTLRSAS